MAQLITEPAVTTTSNQIYDTFRCTNLYENQYIYSD